VDPELLPASVPFAPACSLAVSIPVTSTSRVDSFIDDLVLTFLDTPANRTRCPFAVPLAIHVTSRPHAGRAEPIQRRPLLSPEKLKAEGRPVEVQNVLGWTLDTRRLLILLPHDKYLAWSEDLQLALTSKTLTYDSLESMIGCLNHVSFLIPLSRHFLSHFRSRLNDRRPGKQQITLSRVELDDLLLWQTFLKSANSGISMNRVNGLVRFMPLWSWRFYLKRYSMASPPPSL
jgi:hypothetical protein